ncbi:ATP-binding cassette domain-containing protein [Heyndrickxia acidicola]|uniref:ATP-binding cassette domain-containing protein n=1 Tax=Heyndrickxia acidicola TaxID=209389 RepID=A0ABU6MCV5_9BACI|nr:ATP-binding cassette domain-containing protein [Heyndrickxia acidicola]MED1202248.1 ATP-binding cassette domain-containing protein [Heyndrickxia acidicola]
MFKIRNVVFQDILNLPSVDIQASQVTTLFGESGSGKTTLMKLLNQLISYDKGEIFYQDTLISEKNPIELRREVVMLSQTPAIFDGNIRDNLLIGLRFSGKSDASDSELHKALEMVQLKKDLEEETDTLSGGEKQRLAFARVILMDAKVFLIDEPTSALDENTETAVMDRFIQYVRDHHKTVVMVTHSKAVAERYSDSIIYMNEINKAKEVQTSG